jgi:hypothetical protein
MSFPPISPHSHIPSPTYPPTYPLHELECDISERNNIVDSDEEHIIEIEGNNIVDSDEEHIIETQQQRQQGVFNKAVYFGNYESCLFITANIYTEEYIHFHESAQEYLHDLFLSREKYNEMKGSKNIILDLCRGRGDGWYIDFNPHNNMNQQHHFMKEGARAYINNNFLYINDTGEFGPYSIPIHIIDNLISGNHTFCRSRIIWNEEKKINEIINEDYIHS